MRLLMKLSELKICPPGVTLWRLDIKRLIVQYHDSPFNCFTKFEKTFLVSGNVRENPFIYGVSDLVLPASGFRILNMLQQTSISLPTSTD
jgi:hypothetical protein